MIDFVEQEVNGRVFSGKIWEGAHFDDAQIKNTRFEDCNLYWATFSTAKFCSVSFFNCSLRGADFSAAKFADCTFEKCDFSNDNLDGITDFEDADLTGAVFIDCKCPPKENG